MKTYAPEKIRTIVLVGHSSAGKTSLAEAFLYKAGVTTRMGKTEEGNTVSDFDPDETEKQISVSLSLLPFEWKEHKVNLIDTPGFADFFGDTEAGLLAADAAIFVVSAVDGLEVQARVAWDVAERLKLPRIVVINKMDRERADYQATLDQLVDTWGARIAPVHMPVGQEHDFRGVVDLLNEKEITYEGGTASEAPLAADHAAEIDKLHERLMDSVVEADESLMERYLNEETIEPKEIVAGLHKAIAAGTTVPVLCTAATSAIGVDVLADFIVDELPSPRERTVAATKAGEEIELGCDPSGPLVAQVFKTLSDPYVGRLSYFRVFSGTLRPDATVTNVGKKADERIGNVLAIRGKEQEPVPEVPAGDIAAVAKLSETTTWDTLGDKGSAIELPRLELPPPVYSLAIAPKSKGDEDKLSSGLQRIAAEDPTFRWERNPDTKQTVISGMGDTHLEVVIRRLARHHVEVESFTPKVPYRETIRGTGKADGQLKKQTGGRGQFARCSIEMSPRPRGEGYEFEDAIVGGSIPNNFIPSVDKGVRKAMEEGPLAGYPFVDFKVKLYDGKYHDVDSSDIAFQIAAGMAFKDAATAAGLVLLEPVGNLMVIIPDESVGDIMGDLSARRARIEGTDAIGKGWTQIKAKVPMGEMLRYAIDLRSKTGGRGSFTLAPSHYEEAPGQVQEKVVAEARAQKAEAEKK
ncbi:MAG TPA: elongation factor G [Actinomycetota bacterium]